MIRFLGLAERCTQTAPPNVLDLAAGVAKVVLPDQTKTLGEIAYRYIQNVGANRVYYSFGIKAATWTPEIQTGICDNVATFHGFIEAGQALECGHHRQIVTCFAPGGSTIAVVVIVRNL